VHVENVATNKVIYESSAEDDDNNVNATQTTHDFCNDSVGNTSSSEASWWTVDLVDTYRISFVEISPQPGSLCPENSLCGQFKVRILPRCGHNIFSSCFFLLSLFSSFNLSGRRLDVYHTSTHGVALVLKYRGALKTRDWKTWNWKTRHRTAGLENARLENAAPNCRTGKRGTGKRSTKLQDWKTRDWKTRERIGYGKPLNPEQPTHFQMSL